jgi:Prion-inhibition and propagation
MEPIGFAVGVAGLANIFTSCMDCFEYIQLGRKFGEDYGKCLLRLDAAKVRMSRWGTSIGLGPESHQYPNKSISEEEFHLAQSLLEQIMDSFADAEKLSERYKKHAVLQKAKADDLIVYDAKTDLEPKYQRLHHTMRELAIRRQSGAGLLKKTAWALYEKKKFDTMLDEVTAFVNELLDLFPAAKDDQVALCKAEVSAIKETEDLVMLEAVIGNDDQVLAGTVADEMQHRGHRVTDWEVKGNAKMWAGDDNAFGVESKSHEYSRFTVSGSADVRLGNVNRGK